jgi:hypothetical protein
MLVGIIIGEKLLKRMPGPIIGIRSKDYPKDESSIKA